MLNYLGTITQPSGKTSVLEGVECSFVLKTIDCRELWVGEDFEIRTEVKGRDPKFTWEIVGICRAPNDDMRVMERLASLN